MLHREVSTPSATALMEDVISCNLSPFPMRSPTVRLRLRSPAAAHTTHSYTPTRRALLAAAHTALIFVNLQLRLCVISFSIALAWSQNHVNKMS